MFYVCVCDTTSVLRMSVIVCGEHDFQHTSANHVVHVIYKLLV